MNNTYVGNRIVVRIPPGHIFCGNSTVSTEESEQGAPFYKPLLLRARIRGFRESYVTTKVLSRIASEADCIPFGHAASGSLGGISGNHTEALVGFSIHNSSTT